MEKFSLSSNEISEETRENILLNNSDIFTSSIFDTNIPEIEIFRSSKTYTCFKCLKNFRSLLKLKKHKSIHYRLIFA